MTLNEKLLEAMIKACERGAVTWETTEPYYLWTSSEGWTLAVHHVERGDGESFRDIIEIGLAVSLSTSIVARHATSSLRGY